MLREYIIADLETTGLDYRNCDIIEIGAIKVRDNQVVETFSEFINIGYKIPDFISRLTNITNDELSEGMQIERCLCSFVDFIGDLTIVGHNVKFDYGFLQHNISKYLNIQINNLTSDTIYLAKKKVKTVDYKLATLLAHFNLSAKGHHRAINDVYMTFELLKKLNELPDLQANYPKFNYAPKPSDIKVSKEYDNDLTGKCICFTGDLSFSRTKAMQMVALCGGINQSGITNATDYLVCPDINVSSTKSKKALQMQQNDSRIKIIDEAIFLQMIGEKK